MLRWLREVLTQKDPRDQTKELRIEHLRVLRKAERALPSDDVIRAAVRAAERAMVETKK